MAMYEEFVRGLPQRIPGTPPRRVAVSRPVAGGSAGAKGRDQGVIDLRIPLQGALEPRQGPGDGIGGQDLASLSEFPQGERDVVLEIIPDVREWFDVEVH